jgi:hypothetical protein
MPDKIPAKIKKFVAERAGKVCEYCRCPEKFSSSKFSVKALKLNREEVLNLCGLLFLIGEHPPKL